MPDNLADRLNRAAFTLAGCDPYGPAGQRVHQLLKDTQEDALLSRPETGAHEAWRRLCLELERRREARRPRPLAPDQPRPTVAQRVLSIEPTFSVDDTELAERAIRNAGRLSERRLPRWTHVRDTFGHGSGYSRALCRAIGLNPDEVIGGSSVDLDADQ